MMPLMFTAMIEDENDQVLFEFIWDTYEYMLFKIAYKMLDNRSLAEEAVSETFLKLGKCFQKVHKFEVSKIAAYTVIIIRNTCYDILGSEYKYHRAAAELHISGDSGDADKMTDELILGVSVDKLPDIYKDAIMLKYFYGFTIGEIAEQLGLSYHGARERIETALRLLRKELDDD